MGDPIRIRQVVGNLLSNAIKFTEAGRVVLLVSLQKLSAVHYQLSITVSDSGPGIPKEEQERIFGEFTRLADTEEVEGFGLGLSIAQRITEEHHGRIWVESSGGYNRFTVELPAR